LLHEVELLIQKGDICWIFGHFKYGQFTDLVICLMGQKKELGRGEEVIADEIYGDEAPLKVRAPGTFFQTHKTKPWKREYVLRMNAATDR
jgi:hypothetical protein